MFFPFPAHMIRDHQQAVAAAAAAEEKKKKHEQFTFRDIIISLLTRGKKGARFTLKETRDWLDEERKQRPPRF